MAIYADQFDVETLGLGLDEPGAHKLWCAQGSKPSVLRKLLDVRLYIVIYPVVWGGHVEKTCDMWSVAGGYVKVLATVTRG